MSQCRYCGSTMFGPVARIAQTKSTNTIPILVTVNIVARRCTGLAVPTHLIALIGMAKEIAADGAGAR